MKLRRGRFPFRLRAASPVWTPSVLAVSHARPLLGCPPLYWIKCRVAENPLQKVGYDDEGVAWIHARHAVDRVCLAT